MGNLTICSHCRRHRQVQMRGSWWCSAFLLAAVITVSAADWSCVTQSDSVQEAWQSCPLQDEDKAGGSGARVRDSHQLSSSNGLGEEHNTDSTGTSDKDSTGTSGKGKGSTGSSIGEGSNQGRSKKELEVESAVAKEGMVWATVPMTNTWTDNTKLCVKKGLDLCTKAQLCPGGKPAAKAKMVGWTAIKDANQWVRTKCEDHPGGRPGWGEKKVYVRWRNPKVACCTAAAKKARKGSNNRDSTGTSRAKKSNQWKQTKTGNQGRSKKELVCPKGTGRQGQDKIKTKAAKMDESGCWPIQMIKKKKGGKRFHSCDKASHCKASKAKFHSIHSPVQADTGCAYCPPGKHPYVHYQSGQVHHKFKENYVECGSNGFEENRNFPTDHVSCTPGYLIGGLSKYTECEGTPKKYVAWDIVKQKLRGFPTTSCITVLARVHSAMMIAGNYKSAPNSYNGQGVVIPEAGKNGAYTVRCKMWKLTTCWRNRKGDQKCKTAKRYEFLGLFCMMSPCWANGPRCGRPGSHFEKFNNDRCLLPAARYSELPAYFKQVDSEVGLCSLVGFVQ